MAFSHKPSPTPDVRPFGVLVSAAVVIVIMILLAWIFGPPLSELEGIPNDEVVR